jgi:predicted nucleotidyltransferase/DNA-binding HxlR family transcriptional regulator
MIQMISHEVLTILAKRGRVEIIRTLKSYPGRDFTINELARTARVPTMTAWRTVRDLKKSGFVRSRKVGKSFIVSITEDRDKLRVLRLIPDTDPQRVAAMTYARMLSEYDWVSECRLFGSIGRGEHSPGDEVDVAVIFREDRISEDEARSGARSLADTLKADTNITIVPLCVPTKEMSRKGGLAAELRDKEIVYRRQE